MEIVFVNLDGQEPFAQLAFPVIMAPIAISVTVLPIQPVMTGPLAMAAAHVTSAMLKPNALSARSNAMDVRVVITVRVAPLVQIAGPMVTVIKEWVAQVFVSAPMVGQELFVSSVHRVRWFKNK